MTIQLSCWRRGRVADKDVCNGTARAAQVGLINSPAMCSIIIRAHISIFCTAICKICGTAFVAFGGGLH